MLHFSEHSLNGLFPVTLLSITLFHGIQTNILLFALLAAPTGGDEYHVFLIAAPASARLVLNEIFHLLEISFDWLMMGYQFIFYLTIFF